MPSKFKTSYKLFKLSIHNKTKGFLYLFEFACIANINIAPSIYAQEHHGVALCGLQVVRVLLCRGSLHRDLLHLRRM